MKLPKNIQHNLVLLLITVVASTLFLMLFVSIRQAYRQLAYDPQIQMAEDAARVLERGVSITTIVPDGAVAIDASLSPFLNIYDSIGTPITGSGKLRDSLPKIPSQVFERATQRGQHRLDWSPEKNIHVALVVQPYNNTAGEHGFIVTGRSIRETEQAVTTLGMRLFFAWLFSMGLIAGCWYLRGSQKAVE